MTAAWNVLVFLNAKNDLEQYAFRNFDQMARIGSTPEVNLLVELGRPRRRPRIPPYSLAHGGWSKTLRFHVTAGQQPIEAHAVEDLGATNMGDAATLARFVQWARERYPAKRTLLVIWNHGQGWRAEPDGEAQPSAKASAVTAAGLAGGHRYVSTDDDTRDKLYNRAIQDALAQQLGSDRIDVIAFDACLMAMIETAYALRGVAHVMVGSEELEPANGWNYERWLAPLTARKGDVSATELGAVMVNAMKDEYGDLDDTTLSAIALDKIDGLAAEVTAFADLAIEQLSPATLPAFIAARGACDNYAPGYGMHSIDLGRYMEQLALQTSLPAALRSGAASVRAQLDVAVTANYASSKRQGRYGSRGLAIYYPRSATSYAGDPDREGYAANNAHVSVEFVDSQRWAAFLRAYWKLVP